jgi:hypothetical protein
MNQTISANQLKAISRLRRNNQNLFMTLETNDTAFMNLLNSTQLLNEKEPPLSLA